MYMKKIKYVDFNGVEREEDFYFHLSLPELTRIEAKAGETLKDHITQLVVDQDIKVLLSFLEEVILTSYGERTSDGKTFRKSPEITSDFENSPAYAEFFEMLLTEKGLAQEFGEKVAAKREAKKNQFDPEVINE